MLAFIETVVGTLVLCVLAFVVAGTALVKMGIISVDNAIDGATHDEDGDHPEPPEE